MQQTKQECVVGSAELKNTDKKRKVTAGSVWKSKNYGLMRVERVIDSRNVEVLFIETGAVTLVKAANIKAGAVKDPLKRTSYGIGYLGYGHKNYSRRTYTVWNSMIRRCYSIDRLDKFPSYKGCTVCDEWHNFSVFAEWYESNYPKDGGDYHLDKDIKIVGNKIYSPNTCIFVSSRVNGFVLDCESSRGCLMIGVTADERRGRFQSRCQGVNGKGRVCLGVFKTELEAHLAWRKRKSELAYELAMIQDRGEVKHALLNWRSALDSFEIHKMDTGNYYEAL